MRARLALAAPLAAGLALAAAACAPEAAAPPAPSLPVFADLGMERECACVLRAECPTADAFEGRSEWRGFSCRWDDRAAGRATCTVESRSKPDAPPSTWSSWGRSTVRLRHAGAAGWCWIDRASQNEFTE